MKRIVIYQSGTGFTAKYAGWIAEDLGCEAREYKSVSMNELAGYDMVIYGGWIMANQIVGYDKIRAENLKNLIVFGVGMAAANKEVKEKIAEINQVDPHRFFYFEGGYNPKKLGIMKKMMMNMVKKSIEKKVEKTADDLHMLRTFEGADNTNRDAIRELVEYCKQ